MPVIASSLVFKGTFLEHSHIVAFIYLYSASGQLGFVILFADYSCKGFMCIYFDELSLLKVNHKGVDPCMIAKRLFFLFSLTVLY
jgi:hypothetical protein